MGYSPWGHKRVRDDLALKQQTAILKMVTISLYCYQLQSLLSVKCLSITFTYFSISGLHKEHIVKQIWWAKVCKGMEEHDATNKLLHAHATPLCVCVCVCVYVCVCVCAYLCTHAERERERERNLYLYKQECKFVSYVHRIFTKTYHVTVVKQVLMTPRGQILYCFNPIRNKDGIKI